MFYGWFVVVVVLLVFCLFVCFCLPKSILVFLNAPQASATVTNI